MKTQAIAFIAILFLVLTSCNNDDDNNLLQNQVPNEVIVAFQGQFPNATDVEYQKVGGQYEVDFDINNVEHDALYNADGTLVKYKYDILSSEVPQAILITIETDYENRLIDDAEILMIDEVVYYQIELENIPVDIKLVFNNDGTVNTAIPFWE